jgi:hypothetical protein
MKRELLGRCACTRYGKRRGMGVQPRVHGGTGSRGVRVSERAAQRFPRVRGARVSEREAQRFPRVRGTREMV